MIFRRSKTANLKKLFSVSASLSGLQESPLCQVTGQMVSAFAFETCVPKALRNSSRDKVNLNKMLRTHMSRQGGTSIRSKHSVRRQKISTVAGFERCDSPWCTCWNFKRYLNCNICDVGAACMHTYCTLSRRQRQLSKRNSVKTPLGVTSHRSLKRTLTFCLCFICIFRL